MEVILIIVVLWCTFFLLILRKRGICLYMPTKVTSGKVVDIHAKIRKSREPERDEKRRPKKMTIIEQFATVEYEDNNKTYTAESMFPITNIKVGDIVKVKYDNKNRQKVWISKQK